jgi:DNA polymerase-3 subunit gamma/tau
MSRCLQINFKKATEEELVRSFTRIIKREGLEAEKPALRLIASLSDGSFRDGVKILEEISLIAKNKKITEELVQKNYSIASLQYKIAKMIKFFEEKDTKNGLEIVLKLINEGVDMGNFMQMLIETLHNSMLFKLGIESVAENGGFMIDSLKLEVEQMKKLIELLSKARSELRYAILPQIPLELVIVEWGLPAQDPVVVPVIDKPVLASQNSSVGTVRSPLQSAAVSSKEEAVAPGSNVIQQKMAGYSENDALWTALIDKVKTFNHSIAGVLRGCVIKSYDGKTLLLETNFKFHKEKLSERKTKEILDQSIKDVTKKDVKIEVILKNRQ